MRFRKLICLMSVFALVITAAACAKTEVQTEKAGTGNTAAKTETEAGTAAATEAESAAMVGMANPMVEVTGSSEFKDKLGIAIDSSKLHVPPKMFIIDNKVADIIMNETNVDGEPVEYRLRATKDAGLAPTMHGIYDELTDVGTVDMEFGSTKVKIDQKETKDKKTSVHTWQVGDVYYSLTINNSHSQMQYAEVMDSIFAAIGVAK